MSNNSSHQNASPAPSVAWASRPCAAVLRRSLVLSIAAGATLLVTHPSHAQEATTKPAPPRFAVTRPISSPEALKTRIDGSLAKLEAHGILCAVRIIDPKTGQELYAKNADTPVMPASNMKVPTLAAALDFFGPTKTFQTDLLIAPSDAGETLYLLGHGDPALGDPKIADQQKKTPLAPLDAWADELLAKGKTAFPGGIRYVDNLLDDERVHKTWKDSVTEWYGAPIASLAFNDNCIEVGLEPGEVGQPAKVTIFPDLPESFYKVENKTTTAASRPSPDISRATNANVYTVKGNVVKAVSPESKPVTDPGLFLSEALRTRLEARGIKVAGPTTRASAVPAGATALKPAVSNISDVLWRIGKSSQNMFADTLCKLLGQAYAQQFSPGATTQGSWSAGEIAIRAFFKKYNIDDSKYILADGSGLSRDNRVTAHLMTDIYRVMYTHKDAKLFRNSLTIGGVDGTIRSRFTKTPNRVYAKTGTINGVRSLSGYVRTGEGGGEGDTGPDLIFSLIMNQIPRDIGNKPVEEVQDEIVRSLMEWQPSR